MAKKTIGKKPETVVTGHESNLKTLRQVFKNGHEALIECIDNYTGEKVAVLAAVSRGEGGEYNFTPFALMMNCNPYLRLSPPMPDGGFADTQPEYMI